MKFSEIQIGKKFQPISKITYEKISEKEAKPILNQKNQPITNGLITNLFYNSNINLTVVQ